MQIIEKVTDLIHFSGKKPRVIASDVDHTLVDFDAGHDAGIQAIADVTDSKFAKRVDEIFQFLVLGNRKSVDEPWDQQELHDQLVASLQPHQAHDIEKYGIRKWSRESWILQTALEQNYPITQKFVTTVREAYWDAVAKHAELYPEVPEFFEWLQREKIPLIVMTGSDSVTDITEDPSPRLIYEPKASWDYKMKRLGHIPAQKVHIGDPFDKPHQAFFDGVYASARALGAQSPKEVWFVGDSKGGDLDVPEKDGYLTFWLRRPKDDK